MEWFLTPPGSPWQARCRCQAGSSFGPVRRRLASAGPWLLLSLVVAAAGAGGALGGVTSPTNHLPVIPSELTQALITTKGAGSARFSLTVSFVLDRGPSAPVHSTQTWTGVVEFSTGDASARIVGYTVASRQALAAGGARAGQIQTVNQPQYVEERKIGNIEYSRINSSFAGTFSPRSKVPVWRQTVFPSSVPPDPLFGTPLLVPGSSLSQVLADQPSNSVALSQIASRRTGDTTTRTYLLRPRPTSCPSTDALTRIELRSHVTLQVSIDSHGRFRRLSIAEPMVGSAPTVGTPSTEPGVMAVTTLGRVSATLELWGFGTAVRVERPRAVSTGGGKFPPACPSWVVSQAGLR